MTITDVAEESVEQQESPPKLRAPNYYLRGAVVYAEQSEDGRWKVYGQRWMNALEFSDEDFQRNFSAL